VAEAVGTARKHNGDAVLTVDVRDRRRRWRGRCGFRQWETAALHSGLARRSGQRHWLVPVETMATARLSDRVAFKALASGRRMASRWATTSDKQAQHEETVTDRWAPWPVIFKLKINFKIKFHRGKIARK
jgi:hypothetical protein